MILFHRIHSVSDSSNTKDFLGAKKKKHFRKKDKFEDALKQAFAQILDKHVPADKVRNVVDELHGAIHLCV
jgi:hypothetical protein